MTQLEFLKHSVDTLDRLGANYMIVGSYACMAYGESRLTQDIDIVVDLPMRAVGDFCAAYPSPEFYVSEPAVREAVRDRFQFNVLHPSSLNKIDYILPRIDAWGAGRMSRRQRVKLLPDQYVDVASPEDVILGKLWYHSMGGSEKHLRDIAGILRTSGDAVDQSDISAWAEKLGYSATWNEILKKVNGI